MDNFFNNFNNFGDLSNFQNNFFSNCNLGDLDINKILVILLLLTDRLDIEAIHVYRNNFVVSLGTFNND